MLPVGDLLAHLAAWTDVAPADALAMMRGAAPVSAGASGELERLIAAINARRRRARAARLRRRSRQDARRAARVRRRGRRGDVGVPRPRRLSAARRLRHLRALRARAARRARCARSARPSTARASDTDDVDARIAGIRAQVPEEHRAEFDELLGEARLMYRLRDERGVFSDIWASGHHAPRRARGRSPARRARAASTTPSTSSTPASTRCARWSPARAGRPPTSSRERFADRSSRTAKDAPPSLGPPPPPPPDPSGLPPGVARVMQRDRHRDGRAVRQLRGASTRRTCCAASPPAAVSTKGRRAASSGPTEFDRIVQGDVLVTESTTEAFNILLPLLGAIVTDSRRPALALGDRRPRVRHPRRGRDAERDRPHRRRHARPRRRRRRRSDGLRVTEVVPLADAHEDSRFGAKATGLGSRGARRAADPARHRALGRDRRRRSPPGTSDAIEQLVTAARPLRGAARGAVVGGRRGRRRRELRRPAPHAAQRAVGRRPARGGPRDLVVGELRLGDHLPPARRPLHAPERRRRRAVAARSRRRRGDVHAEPDQRGRRAADRGELGSRRGGRRRPRDPRHASASTAPARCSSARPGVKKIAIRAAADGGTVEETVAPELVEQLCLDDDQLAQLNALAGAVRARSTDRRATSSGRSPAGSSTCCSAAR